MSGASLLFNDDIIVLIWHFVKRYFYIFGADLALNTQKEGGALAPPMLNIYLYLFVYGGLTTLSFNASFFRQLFQPAVYVRRIVIIAGWRCRLRSCADLGNITLGRRRFD